MNIAVWYHCVLSGPRIQNGDHAIAVMCEQMRALRDSGLAGAADEIHLGINGSDRDALLVSSFVEQSAEFHVHGAQAQTELSTLAALYRWLKPGWVVLYHHIKGVQYPGNRIWNNWRRCMEMVCVWNWNLCVKVLQDGSDMAGAHWMTSYTYPMVPVDQRYWGGNFWWAKSDYLMTLPPPAPDEYDKRYDAEIWVGQSHRRPKVVDFARHFPMQCPTYEIPRLSISP